MIDTLSPATELMIEEEFEPDAQLMIRRAWAEAEDARAELAAVKRDRRIRGKEPTAAEASSLTAREERAEARFDLFAFALNLALGASSEKVNRAALETPGAGRRRQASARAQAVEQLSPASQSADGRGGVEGLCARLGWTRGQFYRRAARMKGVFKNDDTKSKSRYYVPDVEKAARLWEAGDTTEQSDR